MKKQLLSVILVAACFKTNAQVLTYLGDTSKLYVSSGALLYSGGTVQADGASNAEIHGNVLIDNGGLGTAKSDGTNFTLNLDDRSAFRQYGQLWINNNVQSQISGTVTKVYSDTSHGLYQQVALPFVGKVFSTLNTELPGVGFTNVRFVNNKASGQNILGWNNDLVREDLFTIESTTQDPTQYYILGTKNLASTYFPNQLSNIKGVPAASGISKTLSNAGAGVNFGVNGNAKNIYKQYYYSYLYDAWDASTNSWTGDYGKNIYQFGNPYLTNLDLTLLPAAVKSAIKGIRYETSNTATNLSNVNHTTKFINFTTSGVAVGDYAAIIKPMQEFVIKLKDNTVKPVINFDALRTFSTEPSNLTYTNTTGTTGRQSVVTENKLNNSTVKQLDVIALDSNKKEIGRTYFVVYAEGHSGAHSGYSVQATADSDVIGTFEEKSSGGIDASLEKAYWLYINEANENDFKGKRVPLALFSDDIAYLQFNVRENMAKIPSQTSTLSSGESFYINTGSNLLYALSQDQIITVPAESYNKNDGLGLYYGKPEAKQVLSTSTNAQKPSATFVAWDDSEKVFKIIFDSAWKSANIQIYDMAGRLISSESKVSTNNNPHVLQVPAETQASFMVRAESETGVQFIQKILKH